MPQRTLPLGYGLGREQPLGAWFREYVQQAVADFESGKFPEASSKFSRVVEFINSMLGESNPASTRPPSSASTGPLGFRCFLCEVNVFPTRGSFMRHFGAIHGYSPIEFHCPVGCGFFDCRRDKMTTHLRDKHDNLKLDKNTIDQHSCDLPLPAVCPSCSLTVRSWDQVQKCVERRARVNDAGMSPDKAWQRRRKLQRSKARCNRKSKHQPPKPNSKSDPAKCGTCSHSFQECSDPACSRKTQSQTSCHRCPLYGSPSSRSRDGSDQGPSNTSAFSTHTNLIGHGVDPRDGLGFDPRFGPGFGSGVGFEPGMQMPPNSYFPNPSINRFGAAMAPRQRRHNNPALMGNVVEPGYVDLDDSQNLTGMVATVAPVHVPSFNFPEIKSCPEVGFLLPRLGGIFTSAHAKTKPGLQTGTVLKVEASTTAIPDLSTTLQDQMPCAECFVYRRAQISPDEHVEVMVTLSDQCESTRAASHPLRTRVQVVVKLLKLRSSVAEPSETKKRNHPATEPPTLALQSSGHSERMEMDSCGTEPQEQLEDNWIIDDDFGVIKYQRYFMNGIGDNASFKQILRDAVVIVVVRRLVFLVLIHILVILFSPRSGLVLDA